MASTGLTSFSLSKLSLSLSFFLFCLSLLASLVPVNAQNGPTNWTVTPFNPPSMPLAVKSPYVNAWAPLGNGPSSLSSAWPRLWTREISDDILGWYASIRVDGTGYQLMGDDTAQNITFAPQKSAGFTPTQSWFVLDCGGKVTVNMTFVTPFEVNDLARLSMPFSYLQITVTSEDSNSHDVQLYSDASGEWISGSDTAVSNWTVNEADDFVYLQMQLTEPQAFAEVENRPQDGILYHAANKTSSTTWQIGPADTIRTLFAKGTALNGTADPNFHAVGDPFDTVGIAVDVGTVEASSSSEPVIFAIGVVRDPVIKFVNSQTLQEEDRSAFYWSEFTNIHDVIEDVLNHYETALGAANSLDSQIASAAAGISSEYYGLLALATRQAMGAIEYTLPRESSGALNTSDIKAFMKDMGSVGQGGSGDASSQANAVDVIYAAMPIYLYLNPEILGYLLSPLLDYQESVQYQNNYAAQDLGGPYPSVPGNFNGHDEQIEQSANMIIMALAHAQFSGDGTLLAQHYDLLSKWGGYLVNNTMDPDDSTTSASDAISLVNQTNVVVKGIIGLAAMSKISDAVGRSSDASQFSNAASSYASQLLSDTSSSSSISIAFGSSSPGFLYNLYADKLLALDIIPSSVYSAQETYYSSAISTNKYGIVVDSTNSSSIARADWMLFSASIATDTSVRNSMINQVYDYVSGNFLNWPFAPLYNPSSGAATGGGGSPAVGAMFAPLALQLDPKTISIDGVGGSSKKSSTGAIVGGVVGSIVGLAAIGGLAFFLWRRRERKATGRYNQDMKDLDRIDPIRVKPVSFPSDQELEPLSSTMHPGMNDLRATPLGVPPSSVGSYSELPYPGPPSTVGSSALGPGSGSGANSSYRGPMVISNLGDIELERNDAAYAAVYAASQAGGSSRSGVSGPKAAMQQDALRSEVDQLRLEIERMKEERMAEGEAPPSYEEELRFANALAKQNYQT